LAIKTLEQQLKTLLQQAEKDPDFSSQGFMAQLEMVVRVVNNQIVAINDQQQRHSQQRMGTTLVMAVMPRPYGKISNEVYVVHVGDSRLYILRHGRVCFQTQDHSVPQALVRAGELAPAAVRAHPDRNRLLRALGDGKPPRPDIYREGGAGFSPTETAVGPNQRLYVADGYGEHWIHIYTLAGEYESSFGGPGALPGQLQSPHGIQIDARSGQPLLQIANRHNRRIDNFTLDGKFIATILDGEQVRYPCTTVPHGEDLYIPDLFCRVSIFDRQNRLIGHLGDYIDGAKLTDWDQFKRHEFPDLAGYPNLPMEKRLPGKFIAPHRLHVNAAGDIYVVEWVVEGRITKLQRLA
jgi:hypothetical protein